jgi:hypothetical protein
MKVKKKQIFHDRTNGYKERTRARMCALVIFKRLTKKCKQRPDHDYTSVDLLVLCLLERFYECIYSNKTTTKKKKKKLVQLIKVGVR